MNPLVFALLAANPAFLLGSVLLLIALGVYLEAPAAFWSIAGTVLAVILAVISRKALLAYLVLIAAAQVIYYVTTPPLMPLESLRPAEGGQ